MGELLVEIMRDRKDVPLSAEGTFRGPFPSGAPAIFIDTAARLGAPAGIIGGVGADAFGDCLLERLRSDAVDCRYVAVYPGRPTAAAFVSYDSAGGRNFIFHLDDTPAVKARCPDVPGELLDTAGFFHVMGCSLMANDEFRRQIIKAADLFADHGARISFDPNIRPELLGGRTLDDIAGPILRKTTLLLPGSSELQMLAGGGAGDADADVQNTADAIGASVGRLFDRYAALQIVAVKQGKEGGAVYSREESFAIEPIEVEEADPTGAGDCFDAGFVCGLLAGRSLPECGEIAARAGAANAAAFGPMQGRQEKIGGSQRDRSKSRDGK